MRSWDLVKGMAYDVMMFGGMALAISRCVGIKPGPVYVTAGSPHIYLAEEHLKPKHSVHRFQLAPELGIEWSGLVEWARKEANQLQQKQTPQGIELIGALE